MGAWNGYGVRRDRCRRALWGIAHGDVARSRRLPGAAGRQGHISERHDVDAFRSSARRCRTRPVGHPRATRSHQLSAGQQVLVRFRSGHDLGDSAASGRRGERLRAQADRARRAARRNRHRGWGVLPTHDDLTCVVMGWPLSQFEANRKDVEGTYTKSFELAPEFAERIKGAKREAGFQGIRDLPGYFRKPYGPGWALVGDAGYHKHPLTAYGITDAFRHAEAVASALDDVFAGRNAYEEAMAGYQRSRD